MILEINFKTGRTVFLNATYIEMLEEEIAIIIIDNDNRVELKKLKEIKRAVLWINGTDKLLYSEKKNDESR